MGTCWTHSPRTRAAESRELPICTYQEDGAYQEDLHYTVVEIKAADGYILDGTAHDVTLRYEGNAPECVVSILEIANVPTEPKLVQTGGNAAPLLLLCGGAAALLAGLYAGLCGKEKKKR